MTRSAKVPVMTPIVDLVSNPSASTYTHQIVAGPSGSRTTPRAAPAPGPEPGWGECVQPVEQGPTVRQALEECAERHGDTIEAFGADDALDMHQHRLWSRNDWRWPLRLDGQQEAELKEEMDLCDDWPERGITASEIERRWRGSVGHSAGAVAWSKDWVYFAVYYSACEGHTCIERIPRNPGVAADTRFAIGVAPRDEPWPE